MSNLPKKFSVTDVEDALNNNNTKAIFSFINNLSYCDDPNAVRALIISIYWEEKNITNNQLINVNPNNLFDKKYVVTFTNQFKALKFDQMMAILKKFGNKNIIKYLTTHIEHLKHLSIKEIIIMLGQFYSDEFAGIIYKTFSNHSLFCKENKENYLKIIRIKTLVQLIKQTDLSQKLEFSDLIICANKIKNYLSGNTTTVDDIDEYGNIVSIDLGLSNDMDFNTKQDCQKIFKSMMSHLSNADVMKKLKDKHIKMIIDSGLIDHFNKNSIKALFNSLVLRLKIVNNNDNNSNNNNNDIFGDSGKINWESLVGVVSTNNFARFERSTKINVFSGNNDNIKEILKGPLVRLPLISTYANNSKAEINDEIKSNELKIREYQISCQIQNLESIFDNNNLNKKGCIFLQLLQAIPDNYKVSVYVSKEMNFQSKDMLVATLDNINCLTIIEWPLKNLGKLTNFDIKCRFQYSTKHVDNIGTGIQGLSFNNESKSNISQPNTNINNTSNNSSVLQSWINNDGPKMVMVIYLENTNNARLPYVNVFINNKMTFGDLLDQATSQLGMIPPNRNDNKNNSNNNNNFFNSNNIQTCNYIVRNQLSYQCNLNTNILKYITSSQYTKLNLLPIFTFTKGNSQNISQNINSQSTFNPNNKPSFTFC